MSRYAVLLVLLSLSSVAAWADEDPEPPPNDAAQYRKLRGTWAGVRKVPKGDKGPVKLVYEFDGKKVKFTNGTTTFEGTLALDRREKPSRLTLSYDKKSALNTFLYKLDGDRLYLLSATKNKLKGKADPFDEKNTAVIVLTRQKAR